MQLEVSTVFDQLPDAPPRARLLNCWRLGASEVSLSLAHYLIFTSKIFTRFFPLRPSAPRGGKHSYLLISSASNCDKNPSFSWFCMAELVFSGNLCLSSCSWRGPKWRLEAREMCNEQLVANCILVRWASQFSELHWCEVFTQTSFSSCYFVLLLTLLTLLLIWQGCRTTNSFNLSGKGFRGRV